MPVYPVPFLAARELVLRKAFVAWLFSLTPRAWSL